MENIYKELNSSAIQNGSYFPDHKILKIIFNDDTEYDFEKVEEDVANAFFNAESHGKYFNENIRGKYNFSKN